MPRISAVTIGRKLREERWEAERARQLARENSEASKASTDEGASNKTKVEPGPSADSAPQSPKEKVNNRKLLANRIAGPGQTTGSVGADGAYLFKFGGITGVTTFASATRQSASIGAEENGDSGESEDGKDSEDNEDGEDDDDDGDSEDDEDSKDDEDSEESDDGDDGEDSEDSEDNGDDGENVETFENDEDDEDDKTAALLTEAKSAGKANLVSPAPA